MSDNEKYTCPVCNETMKKTSKSRHNRLKHKKKGPRVMCTHDGCGRYFQDDRGVRAHFEAEHSGNTYPCVECGDVFKKKQDLVYHNKTRHSGGFPCPHPGCKESRRSKKNLQNHINLPVERGGHDGKLPETGNKRKVEKTTDEIDPVEDFLASMKDKLKNSDPVKTRCISKETCFTIQLAYGFPGQSKTYCSKHKDEIPGLVNEQGICKYVGCATRGHDRVGRYSLCADHRKLLVQEGLPDPEKSVKKAKDTSKKCVEDGCTTIPTFDGGKYCGKHSPTGASDDKRVCEVVGCEVKRPAFGYPDQTPIRCKDHKEEGMYSHKLCEEEGCYISASYGTPGSTALYCVEHRRDGHIVIGANLCKNDLCDKQASFGVPGSTTYSYCKEHAPHGSIDIRNDSCKHEGCTKNPSFGLEGGERIWCGEHKTDDCVNLVVTMCSMACCANGPGIQAKFFHPDHQDTTSEFYKKRICSFGRRVLIEDALMHNDIVKLQELLTHFDLDNVLTLNAQSAFRFACEENYFKELGDCVDIVFDETVTRGPKLPGAKRPDIFYKWVVNGLGYGIHIEYDESSGHEDCKDRLEWIAKEAGCESRVYVIRVEGGHGTKNPICTRVDMENYGYYRITDEGRRVASRVSDAVVRRIKWIQEGLAPL